MTVAVLCCMFYLQVDSSILSSMLVRSHCKGARVQGCRNCRRPTQIMSPTPRRHVRKYQGQDPLFCCWTAVPPCHSLSKLPTLSVRKDTQRSWHDTTPSQF